MAAEGVDRYLDSPSAYVHIPFCARVCPYCDFAVVAGKDDLAERYIEAVISEIGMTPVWKTLDSVYFGGGTPSHVDPSLLGKALDRLVARHGLSENAEVTLEANPEDFDLERAQALKALGFNRVSFGAQSLDGRVLASLGRRHNAEDVVTSVTTAREAGFESISVDLIYGTPGETDTSWEETLGVALGLGTDHMSCYALTVEGGTPLGREVKAGAPEPDPDVQADRYEYAQTSLAASGFGQYEVSNWARPDRECGYNLTVWAQGEYLAYGNGAHGHLDHTRFRNVRRLDAYITTVESGALPRAGEDRIDGWAREIDRLFVGLRRTAGVTHGPGTEALLGSDDGQRLFEAGVIEDTGDRLVVKRPLLTDAVHRAVLGLQDPTRQGTGYGPARTAFPTGITCMSYA